MRRPLTLAGGGVRLEVSPETGELAGLCRKLGGKWRQLVYRSGRGWRGGAPWLFPAVGRNFVRGRLAWRHRGRVLPMPIHGFTRRLGWTASKERAAVTCRAESGPSTRRFYPFDFAFTVRYSLLPAGCLARVEISASKRNSGPMPFSLGSHLTLRAPRGCAVSTSARASKSLSKKSLLTGHSRRVDLRRAAAPEDVPALLDGVFGDFPKGDVWAELSGPGPSRVRVRQREIVPRGREALADMAQFHFVFYGDPKAGYLCPEPWYGAPDSLNAGRGLVRLAPGARFLWEMRVEAF